MREEKLKRYGLFSSIFIALGPILWLFINLHDKRYEDIVLNIILAVIGVTVIIFNIIVYLKGCNSRKSNAFRSLISHIGSFLCYIVLMVIGIIVLIAFGEGISFIQNKLFIKGNYMFSITKYPYSHLIFVMMIIVGYRMMIFLHMKKNFFSMSKELPVYLRFDKLLMVVIPLMYLIVTNFVVVTEEGIYDYSFYNLKGNKYSFSDVEIVNTGFISSGRNKGEFYYNIELKNGKVLKLSHPSMTDLSEKYQYDTWQEYVDIDKYIMDSGAKKQSSEYGSEYVRMDKIYVDKLLTAVRNK